MATAEMSMLEMAKAVSNLCRFPASSSFSAVVAEAARNTERVDLITVRGGRPDERNLVYVKALLAAIILDELPEETRSGFFISALFAEMGDQRQAMEAFVKRHHLASTSVTLAIRDHIAVGDCEATRALVDTLDNGDITGNPNLFESRTKLGEVEGVPTVGIITIIAHLIMIASKAITAPTACVANARRRMDAMMTRRHPVDRGWLMLDELAGRAAVLIRKNIIVRRAIVDVVESSLSHDAGTSDQCKVIAHAGGFLRGVGLTGFNMVCRFVVDSRAPILAKPALRSEVETFRGILKVYHSMGSDAPYLKFLGSTKSSMFWPGSFPVLHAFALGCASVHLSSMAGYATSDAVIARPAYHAGRAFAEAGGGTPGHQPEVRHTACRSCSVRKPHAK